LKLLWPILLVRRIFLTYSKVPSVDAILRGRG
jgi:hypothetical protein